MYLIFGNLIAHGKKVLDKYGQPISFTFEPPELAYMAVEKWDLREAAF